jgi:hypothetical protein
MVGCPDVTSGVLDLVDNGELSGDFGLEPAAAAVVRVERRCPRAIGLSENYTATGILHFYLHNLFIHNFPIESTAK